MKKNKFKIYKLVAFTFLVLFGFKTIVFGATETLDCIALGELEEDLNNIFNFLKIILPLLVIGLSSFDFIKAIAGKDNKDVKKAFNRLLKRLALAIVFFFLPMLIELLLKMFFIDSTTCIN